jgi:hypothetical protein
VNSLFSETLVLWIAMVFAMAAVGKLVAWEELAGVVQNFRVLPRSWSLPVAFVLPPLEAAVAIGVLLPTTRVVAAAGAALLFAVFGVALALNLYRGRPLIDCGCFRSGLKQPISWAVVVRNIVLTLAALLLVQSAGAASLSPLGWVMAIGAAVTLVLCYLSVGFLF